MTDINATTTSTASPDDVAALRRQVAALRAKLPKARLRDVDGGEPDGRDETGLAYLTIHEAAERLNVTAEAAGRLLARVPTRLDLNGLPVVQADLFEQALLDLADGRDPSRFL